MTRLDGFDVFHGNVVVDASKIPGYPVAIHKLSEGATSTDPLAAERLAMFTARGIVRRGGYHWLRSDSPIPAQFANFRSALSRTTLVDKSGALSHGSFVMLDWERSQNVTDPTQAQGEEWCALATAAFGDRLCVYAGSAMSWFKPWRKQHPDMPLWFAAYGNYQPTAEGFGAMCWQFTDHAQVPGFAAPVDGNTILRPDVLDRICGLTGGGPTFPNSLQEDDMKTLTNGEPRDIHDGNGQYPAAKVYYKLLDNDTVEHITSQAVLNARAGNPPVAQALSNADLDALGAV